MFFNRSRQVLSKNVHLGNFPMTVGWSVVCGTGALFSKEYPCGIGFFRIYPRQQRPFLTQKNKMPQRALKALQRVLKTVHGARRTKLSKWTRKMTEFVKKNPDTPMVFAFSTSRSHTYRCQILGRHRKRRFCQHLVFHRNGAEFDYHNILVGF